MPVDGEADAASPGATVKKAPARPEFARDAKFERLVPLFGVDLTRDLDNKQLRLVDFQKRAAALHKKATGVEKAPGAFKSWSAAVDSLLEHCHLYEEGDWNSDGTCGDAAPTPAPGAPAPEQEQEQAPDDSADAEAEAMAQVLSVVDELLAGAGLSPETEAFLAQELNIQLCEKALSSRCDQLEAAVRASFETVLSSDSQTVAHVLSVIKVTTCPTQAHQCSPAYLKPCTPLPARPGGPTPTA